MSTFVRRMVGAAKLNATIYEEIETDAGSARQAMAVVCLSAVAAAIGRIGPGGVRGPVIGLVAAPLGWLVWTLLTWFIGTKILPEAQTEASPGQLLRTAGFSTSPGVFRAFGFIPILGGRHLVRRFRLDARLDGRGGPPDA